MKKLIGLAVALALLGLTGTVWADSYMRVQDGSTLGPRLTVTVFNDSGSTLTSGAVVVWDNDDTEFDRTGYPYVTTTTGADSPWVAGVMLNDSCPDQTLCEIGVYGPTRTNMRGTYAEDTLVGTQTTAGTADDYGTGANTCALGMLMEDRNLDTGGACSTNANITCPEMVFVNVNCQ